MPETSVLAARLSHIRMANSKFQSELAAESHICEKTIRNLEKARANPTLKTLNGIATNFGVPVSAFFKLDPTSFIPTALPERHEDDDPASIIREIRTLSRWLHVFLAFSGETQQEFSDHTGSRYR